VVAGRYLEPPDGGRSRAKLKRLLRRARTKVFEAVCVLRLDDLAASRPGAARVAWELDEVGVRVVSTSEPQLDLRAPALRWIAEDQPRRSQRVKDALQAKRARGKRMGAVPRGFRLALDGVRQEPDETEQTVIKQAVALSKSGASLSSIARRLTEQGYRSRNGTPFSHNQISRMLARVRGDQQSMP
jgi:DNA invertase Pin-like site-specific DNA recombinase